MKELFTERQALKEYIEQIKIERRELANKYWEAIERLREIDDKQNKMFNGEPLEAVNGLVELVREQGLIINQLSALVPKVPAEIAVEHWKQSISKFEDESEGEEISRSSILDTLKLEIEVEKDYEEKVSIMKKKKYNDFDKISSIIVQFLKEKEKPASLNEIKTHLNELGNKYKTVSSLMTKLMERDSRVTKAYRGYYQIKI